VALDSREKHRKLGGGGFGGVTKIQQTPYATL